MSINDGVWPLPSRGQRSSSTDGLTSAVNSGTASGSNAPIEADAGVDCYDATPTGDGERVFDGEKHGSIA
jgi:hypothetical protein